MSLLILVILGAAMAGPTYNMPHAAEQDSSLRAGPGVALLRAGPLPGGRISGSLARGDLGLSASAAGYLGQTPDVFTTAGVRWRLHDGERVSLAPVAMLGGHWGSAALTRKATGRLGLAAAGGGRLRWDVSLAVAGGQWFPAPGVSPSLSRLPLMECLLGSELGLSMQPGAEHWVRLGLLGAFPMIRYAWRGVTVTAITAGTQHLLQLEVGWSDRP